MSVALDTASGDHTIINVKSFSYTATSTGGTNNYVRLGLAWECTTTTVSTTISTCTYGGTAMVTLGGRVTRTGTGDDGNTFTECCELRELKNPGTGNQTVNVDFSAGANFGNCGSMFYTGVDQTTPSGTAVTNTGTGTTISDNVASNAGDMISDVIFAYGATASATMTSTATGATARFNTWAFTTGGNNFYFGCGQDTASSGTVAMSWSGLNSHGWCHSAAQIIAATTTGGGPLIRGGALLHGALIRGGRLAA